MAKKKPKPRKKSPSGKPIWLRKLDRYCDIRGVLVAPMSEFLVDFFDKATGAKIGSFGKGRWHVGNSWGECSGPFAAIRQILKVREVRG